MATTFELSGGLSDAGVPFDAAKPALMWVALENAASLIDTDTDRLIVGRWPLDLDAEGDFTKELPSTASGAGYDPNGGFAYRLYAQYRDGGDRKTFVSQPFTLTADTTLSAALGGTIELTAVSAAEWADFQAKYDEIKDVVATTDGLVGESLALRGLPQDGDELAASIAAEVNTPGTPTYDGLSATIAAQADPTYAKFSSGLLKVGGVAVAPGQVGAQGLASELEIFAKDFTTVSGAVGPISTHLNRCPVLKYPKHEKVADSFNRANSTTTLGALDTGQAWTQANATWGIDANSAYSLTGASSPRITTASSSAEGITEVTIAALPSAFNSDVYVMRRWADANNYVALGVRYNGRIQLWHRIAGVDTALATADASFVVAPGDKVRLETYGATMYAFHNDVLAVTATTTVLTGTSVGIKHSDTDASVRIGDFVTTDIDLAVAYVKIPDHWANFSVLVRFTKMDAASGSAVRWRYSEAEMHLDGTTPTVLTAVSEIAPSGIGTTVGAVQDLPMSLTRPAPTDGNLAVGVSRVSVAVGDTAATGDTAAGPLGFYSLVLRQAA